MADIFRRYGVAFRAAHERVLSCLQRRVMQAIAASRTARGARRPYRRLRWLRTSTHRV
ncbi:hypothetical protein SALB1_3710 [Salinisphaera sp. LB1]|nr:hypothetical protein SALB1_3710 [Salinisphaera sp. LB1]